MNKFLTQSLFILATLITVMVAQAQTPTGRYEIRLVPGAYNCTQDSVVVCVEIRATSVDSAFVMGNANLQLTYPSNQLSSPVFRSRGIYNGGVYSPMTMTKTSGTTTSALSINIVNNGVNGQGQMVDINWRMVACLAFSTAGNSSKCYGLTISPTNPTTVVTMAYPNPDDPQNNLSLTKEVSQGALTSISNQCPINPTAILSGGGTINAGDNTNLVITSQNNVFPATVVLSSNGGTATLTAQSPSKTLTVSPNQTTNYTIQSVTGECGAGSGQGAANVIVTNTPPIPNCPPLKCIPLTLRIVK